MRRHILLVLGVGLLTAGLSAYLQTKGLPVLAFSSAESTTPSATVAEGVGRSFEVAGSPARLRIPAISVDANVQSVGLAWQGTGDMGVPTNLADVGWYNGGPVPGMPGTAVIDGHLDGKDVPEAVFYNLDKLKIGDLVEVEDKAGKVFQFRVVGTKIYDYDAPTADVFLSDNSKARLNLITCAGSWLKSEKSYAKRVVVFTELVTS